MWDYLVKHLIKLKLLILAGIKKVEVSFKCDLISYKRDHKFDKNMIQLINGKTKSPFCAMLLCPPFLHDTWLKKLFDV